MAGTAGGDCGYEFTANLRCPTRLLKCKLDARGKRFAIVVARFDAFITERLLQGAINGAASLRRKSERCRSREGAGNFRDSVGGANPAQRTRRYNTIPTIGCLLRGDTARYDVIVNKVARGVGQSAQRDRCSACVRRPDLRHAGTSHRSCRIENGEQRIRGGPGGSRNGEFEIGDRPHRKFLPYH